MKVLQINSVCGIRSTGRICTDIADVLRAEGHECKIAYGRETVPERYLDIAYRITGKWGNRIDGLKSRFLDNAGFNSRRQTKRFVQWMREYDPDVIHLHNLHGYYINIDVLFRALKEMDKPVVWTLHDCWPFTGHCAYFDEDVCGKWRTGCEKCNQKGGYPSSCWKDRSQRNYIEKKALFSGVKNMTIVTPSHWLAKLVKASWLGCYPVEVIHNGIDTGMFRPIEGNIHSCLKLEGKKIALGVSAIWNERKGYADMQKLAELLPEPWRVVLVGVSPEQKEKLPSCVTAITRTDNVEQLAQLYSAAQVLINPTYQDNYPTVNLEAQACGTPVITYRTGGSVESVPAAQVVEQGDVQSICRLLEASQNLKIMQADRSIQTACNQYYRLYNDLGMSAESN